MTNGERGEVWRTEDIFFAPLSRRVYNYAARRRLALGTREFQCAVGGKNGAGEMNKACADLRTPDKQIKPGLRALESGKKCFTRCAAFL